MPITALLRLLRPHGAVLLGSTILGVLGGLSVTALLAIINDSLQADGQTAAGALAAFAGLCLAVLLGSILSDMAPIMSANTSSPSCATS